VKLQPAVKLVEHMLRSVEKAYRLASRAPGACVRSSKAGSRPGGFQLMDDMGAVLWFAREWSSIAAARLKLHVSTIG